MNTFRTILLSLLLTLMGYASISLAEDTDLYSGLGAGAGIPNVLIILDNAASFDANLSGTCAYSDAPSTIVNMMGKLAGLEQCALNNVIYALPTNDDGTARVNVGIMVYGATGIASAFPTAGCVSSNNGGCLISPLTPMTAANKATLMALIKSWTIGNIKANGEGTSLAMQEAWAYYAGQTGASGRSYAGIRPTDGCQKNFVIFLGNAYNTVGTPGDGGSSSPSGLLNAAGATTEQKASISIPYAHGAACNTSTPYYSMPSHNDSSGLYADEWARFMYQADIYGNVDGSQSITTYTVAALGAACKADYPALLTSMAHYGGGKYFPVSADAADDVVQAFLKILNEVQAVNSVFSSSSLPVSVNAQGTYLNQIYMGMFRPDATGAPRWVGNLKQYQFVATRNATTNLVDLYLGDSNGDAAISSAGTGFISPNATSFWTCGGNPSSRACSPVADTVGGFWVNNPHSVGGAYDLPDGELVEKGGAAQMMRLANLTADYATTAGTTTNPRKLYTYCPSGGTCNTTLSDPVNVFDHTNAAITDAMLGTGSRTISSITSAATVSSGISISPGVSGTATTVSITAFSKAGSLVTATVSAADVAKLSGGAHIKIATGAAKYDCDPCTVATLGATSFTYSKSGGGGTPTTPYTATVYNNFAVVTKSNHGLTVGQIVTIKVCTTHTALNNTVSTVSAKDTNTFTLALTTAIASSGADTACTYTPNTATVTTTGSHGYAAEEIVAISGSSTTGYNGTWAVTPTGDTTFTYQYTAIAPLASSSTGTATGNTVTRVALTKWVRGEDNFGDEDGPGGAITVRPSLHGDVLHSRPVTVNYGGSIGVVVFYGSNDGVYRAINGNQTNPAGSSLPAPGSELWGFIPTEFFGKLKRQHTNSPELLLPSTPSGIIPAPQKKDYFADGTTNVYRLLNADGSTNKAYIYFTMRRGGNFIYALDVTDPTSPKYLWKITNTGDFTELGQTWSAPKVALIKGYKDINGAKPVLIFGAGYATTQDSEPATTDTVGRGIYIVDAKEGTLVWSATHGGSSACSEAICTVSGMNYSIPADVTLLDRDSDGYIDRLYAVDVGGNVWRVDLQPAGNLNNNTPFNWRVHQVAALGGSSTPLRKFFFPPDVIYGSTYDMVIAGSGDREHPLSSTTTRDRIFVLQDLPGNDGSGLTTPIVSGDLFDSTSVLYDASAFGSNGSTSPNKGYFKDHLAGEKIVNEPLTVGGYTYYGTNQPSSADSCSANLGIAKGYKLNPFTGAARYSVYDGGGLPPSAVAGRVTVSLCEINGCADEDVEFCIGCGGGGSNSQGDSSVSVSNDENCNSAIGGCSKNINPPLNRTRTYWYQEID